MALSMNGANPILNTGTEMLGNGGKYDDQPLDLVTLPWVSIFANASLVSVAQCSYVWGEYNSYDLAKLAWVVYPSLI